MWILVVVVLQMVWWLLVVGAAIAVAAVQFLSVVAVVLVRVLWAIVQLVVDRNEERRLGIYREPPPSRPLQASAHSPSGSELWREYRETAGR